MHRIAQISDCHFMSEYQTQFKSCLPAAQLEKILAHIKALPQAVDAIVFSGDIVQQEVAASYQLFKQIVEQSQLPQAKYIIAGNHDQPEYIEQLKQSGVFNNTTSFTLGNWQLILLNSYLSDANGAGYVSEYQLEQLAKQAVQTPFSAAFVHHHIAPFNSFIDNYPLKNAAECIERFSQLEGFKGVFHGHTHAYKQGQVGDIKWFSCPASSVQFDHTGKHSYLPRSGYQLIELSSQGRISTQPVWFAHETE